ncbi:hypothetical protein BOX15_Mlig033998g6 [Macrostomum lignano]|uniref:Trimethylguanosine synthase n=1 Tax=Macrostomum lignano TaxID=282301 RepID=A0A267G9S5_9PLAT|nr:hypothetical protein BOX15_Mlig033998g6 [Macrostomum lignano]
MFSDNEAQEFTAQHWKRLAHLAVTYKQSGDDNPLRAFLTRAFITDGKIYDGKFHKEKQNEECQVEVGKKYDDSLNPDESDAQPVVMAAVPADAVSDRLAELCISADSGTACDGEEETRTTEKEIGTSTNSEMNKEACEVMSPEDEERMMAMLGLPTNFAVRQRRQRRDDGDSSRKPGKRPMQHQDRDAPLMEPEKNILETADESPKRRKSIPEVVSEDFKEDANEEQVYHGPHWPDYEWIAGEFERYWNANRDRCIWLAWVRRFGAYMTEESWSGMPASLRENEEFLQLLREQQGSNSSSAGLPVQDWDLEWQRNSETAYWAEILRFVSRYRPGSGAKQSALRLAKRLGFVYKAHLDQDHVSASNYQLLPAGETAAHLSYKDYKAIERDAETEAAEAKTALQDPILNKYWNQRYRFFDKFDDGIQLDREAWFSVTPQRIARHQAERLKCPGILIDAFCGAGGNVIQFAQLSGHVIAIDIDPSRLAMAEHNAGVYGVLNNISFLCEDFFDAVPRLGAIADAIFLSPPWGGPSYLDKDVFDLDEPVLSGGRSVADCVRSALAHCASVAIYLPRNVDLGQLTRLLAGCRAGIVEVEQNMLNGRLKAITVYTGGLVDAVTADY